MSSSNSNISRRRSVPDPAAAAMNAIKELLSLDPESGRRKPLMESLGDGKILNKRQCRDVVALHQDISIEFMAAKDIITTDDDILHLLSNGTHGQASNLHYLLSKTYGGQTVLHSVLDPSTYADKPGGESSYRFDFDHIKPFIHFLLRLHPDLPVMANDTRQTPLFLIINSPDLDPSTKAKMVSYFCDPRVGNSQDTLDSHQATESLTTLASLEEGRRHAVHQAIENDVYISEAVVRNISKITAPIASERLDGKADTKSCLKMTDYRGRSCLHLALMKPFTPTKMSWAKTLVMIQKDLLRATYKHSARGETTFLTPLQYFTEERTSQTTESSKGPASSKAYKVDKSKKMGGVSGTQQGLAADKLEVELDNLEEWLKYQCLVNFHSSTCREIMYRRKNARETYLAFEKGDIISGDSLVKLQKHYILDTILSYVYIPRIVVKWGDEVSTAAHNKAKSWRCAGNTDMYMIFQWLKNAKLGGVKMALEVIVDDFGHFEQRPHSDEAITECLRNLNIEIWNWRRMDIPSDVIQKTAGESVKTVNLYCSGLASVLRSWSGPNGLPQLKKLETVYLETHQGLESIDTMTNYVNDFKSELEKNFDYKFHRKLIVHCTPVKPTQDAALGNVPVDYKVKDADEEGFEEQDWLKCMDEFANVIDMFDQTVKEDGREKSPVKVALIDDGVKSSYAGLDDNIDRGQSWVTPARSKPRSSSRFYTQNYNTSYLGHGTVMAYYIRRVCPRVRLYVAKLAPQRIDAKGHTKVSFTIESATKAINWAVDEEVDIISMSWAIDERDLIDGSEPLAVAQLRSAIKRAADCNILLFCANPDKGHGQKENKTYPRKMDIDRIFCIGAATQSGSHWDQIDPLDTSCNYFLPGVELGIPVDNSSHDAINEPRASKRSQNAHEPPSIWRTYSGSSLSCALATGLAAMILHCTHTSGEIANSESSPEWSWLKSYHGMREAFNSIHVTESRWLPVRRVFSTSLLYNGVSSERRKALKEIVETLTAARPRQDLPVQIS